MTRRLVKEFVHISRGAAPVRHLTPSTRSTALKPAYVASTVSVFTTPASDVFRRAELRSMYVRAEA